MGCLQKQIVYLPEQNSNLFHFISKIKSIGLQDLLHHNRGYSMATFRASLMAMASTLLRHSHFDT